MLLLPQQLRMPFGSLHSSLAFRGFPELAIVIPRFSGSTQPQAPLGFILLTPATKAHIRLSRLPLATLPAGLLPCPHFLVHIALFLIPQHLLGVEFHILVVRLYPNGYLSICSRSHVVSM